MVINKGLAESDAGAAGEADFGNLCGFKVYLVQKAGGCGDAVCPALGGDCECPQGIAIHGVGLSDNGCGTGLHVDFVKIPTALLSVADCIDFAVRIVICHCGDHCGAGLSDDCALS